jgi:hypothetical protein
MGTRPVAVVGFYSAEGPDYLKAHYRGTYGWMAKDAKPERSLFPRIAPVVLAGIALWPPFSVTRVAYSSRWRSRSSSRSASTARYSRCYENVPPFGNIRVPARHSVLAGLSLAVLSAFGAARVLARWPRAQPALIAAMLAVISYEALPNMELVRPWPSRRQSTGRSLANPRRSSPSFRWLNTRRIHLRSSPPLFLNFHGRRW